jgi:hypothetical protein
LHESALGSTFLGELPKRFKRAESRHYKSGVRSARAIDLLKQSGFKQLRNMKGGILAWSDKVDPSVPKY